MADKVTQAYPSPHTPALRPCGLYCEEMTGRNDDRRAKR